MPRDSLRAETYDALIVATGALPKVFSLGADKPVLDAKTALRGQGAGLGQKIVIVGGGMVGCELALWLRRELGREVTIVESLDKLLAINAPICTANRDMLQKLIPFSGCQVVTRSTAVRTTPAGVLIRSLEDQSERELAADTVILAVGFQSDRSLFLEMQDAAEIYEIGDCRQFKNVHQAIWDAYEVANHI